MQNLKNVEILVGGRSQNSNEVEFEVGHIYDVQSVRKFSRFDYNNIVDNEDRKSLGDINNLYVVFSGGVRYIVKSKIDLLDLLD